MNKSWYICGFGIILLAIVAFQLMWLPAPYFFGRNVEWIAYINYLYYGSMLIPACWLVGALVRVKQSVQQRLRITIIRTVVIVGSISIIVLLSQPLQHIMLLMVIVVITIISIIAELLWCRAIEMQSRAGIHSSKLKKSIQSFVRVILLYVVAIVILLCPTGYNVTYPAMTMNMNTYAAIGENNGDNGIIEGVLVFERPAFPIDWIYKSIFPIYSLERRAKNEPSIAETYSEVVAMKQNTDQLAAAVAWERAGLGDAVIYDGVQIIAIVANSPADGKLQAGDIVKAINGAEIKNARELISYMSSAVQVGEQVMLDVQRKGNRLSISVTTAASPEAENRAVLGVSIQDAYTIHVEQELTFKSYLAHAGGPSHGAMLTLAFLDQLTDGDITGGLKIAGTGTIEPNGSIGMVGGIPQKAYAVSKTAADVFFVPEEAMLAATTAAPNLRIVPVTSIFDILNWIEINQIKDDSTEARDI